MAFTDTERLIGDAAKNQVAMNPHNTVFGQSSGDEKGFTIRGWGGNIRWMGSFKRVLT